MPPNEAEIAQRLREWVHERYGKWITFATALRAIRRILASEQTP